jgi:hypothetical protein
MKHTTSAKVASEYDGDIVLLDGRDSTEQEAVLYTKKFLSQSDIVVGTGCDTEEALIDLQEKVESLHEDRIDCIEATVNKAHILLANEPGFTCVYIFNSASASSKVLKLTLEEIVRTDRIRLVDKLDEENISFDNSIKVKPRILNDKYYVERFIGTDECDVRSSRGIEWLD